MKKMLSRPNTSWNSVEERVHWSADAELKSCMREWVERADDSHLEHLDNMLMLRYTNEELKSLIDGYCK